MILMCVDISYYILDIRVISCIPHLQVASTSYSWRAVPLSTTDILNMQKITVKNLEALDLE